MKIHFRTYHLAALLLGLCSLCLFSCDSDTTGDPDNQVAVQFSTGGQIATPQSPQTRGSTHDLDNPYWQDLDSIGIFMIPEGNRTSPLLSNRLYVTRLQAPSTEATFQPDKNNHIYLSSSRDAEFIAYFPYKYYYNGNITIDLDSRSTISHDLRVSEPVKADKNNPNVKLKFRHLLSRVTVEMTGDGVTEFELSQMVLKILDTPSTVRYNILENKLTTLKTKNNILLQGSGNKRSCIVLPTEPSTKLSSRRIEFRLNSKVFNYYFPQDLDFEAGKQYNFKITVSRGVTATSVSVTEWTHTDVSSTPPQPMLSMETVLIRAGSFLMGSPENEPGRSGLVETQHYVTLTKDYRIGKYEVTCAQYAAFLNATGVGNDGKGYVKGYGNQVFTSNNRDSLIYSAGSWQILANREEHPVVGVSWYGAKAFADWMGASLPTEAQWEYACRAGTTTAWSFGSDSGQLSEYAWFSQPNVKTRKVGQKEPNPWGLYDMHGNALEYCSDWFSNYYGAVSADELTAQEAIDPAGAAEEIYRVIKGGCFQFSANNTRSAYRGGRRPDYDPATSTL